MPSPPGSPAAPITTRRLTLAEAVSRLPLSPGGQALLLQLATEHGWTRNVDEQARHLGLQNGDALRRHLRELGLPDWRFLKRWLKVYHLVQLAEQGHTLAASALSVGHNPSSTYRSVGGLLKLPSSKILAMGGTELLFPLMASELAAIHKRQAAGAPDASAASESAAAAPTTGHSRARR